MKSGPLVQRHSLVENRASLGGLLVDLPQSLKPPRDHSFLEGRDEHPFAEPVHADHRHDHCQDAPGVERGCVGVLHSVEAPFDAVCFEYAPVLFEAELRVRRGEPVELLHELRRGGVLRHAGQSLGIPGRSISPRVVDPW